MLVWQQILCGYSLMSATTPCLKGFLGRFRTEDLARVTDSVSGSRSYGDQNSRKKSNPDSYFLQSLDRQNNRRRPTDEELLACHPPDVLHSATAYADADGDHGEDSVKSFGSERMMIHRTMEYSVTSS